MGTDTKHCLDDSFVSVQAMWQEVFVADVCQTSPTDQYTCSTC